MMNNRWNDDRIKMSSKSMPARSWNFYFLGGLLGALIFLWHPNLVIESVLVRCLGVYGLAGIWAGLMRSQPQPRWGWRLFAVGAIINVTGDFFYTELYYLNSSILDPTVGVLIYMLGIVCSLGGLGLVVFSMRHQVTRDSLIQGLIITTGFFSLIWLVQVEPNLKQSQDLFSWVKDGGIPLGLVAAIAFCCVLTATPTGRTWSFRLTFLACLLFVLAAFLQAIGTTGWPTPFADNAPSDLVYLSDMSFALAYLTLALAFLHPSIRTFHAPSSNAASFTRDDLVLLGIAFFLTPIAFLVQSYRQKPTDIIFVMASSLFIFSLVMLRVNALMRTLDLQRQDLQHMTTNMQKSLEQARQEIAQRALAEVALRESHQLLEGTFASLRDAVFIIDANTTAITDCNPAAAEIFGYSREDMLGRTTDFLHVDQTTLEEFRKHLFPTVAEKGFLFLSEFKMKRRDGTVFSTEHTVMPLEDEQSKRIGWVSVVRDITERKQREHELQAIASLSAVLRTAPTRAVMLPVIVEQLVALLNCDSASVEVIDPATGDAIVEAAHGVWQSLIGSHQKDGTGMNAIINKTRQPFSTNDWSNDPNLAYPEWTASSGIRAGAGAPLIVQDKLIGFVWMGRKTQVSQSEVHLLMAVADIAANAIHRTTMHERTQKDAADLALAYDTTLEGWARALELRDQETEGHTRRVVQMTVDLAHALGIGKDELENVRRGTLLHDIGKMGIPDSVLLKPGTLNEREWEIMRRHPEYAFKLLEPIEYLHQAADIPYCHHEKWDGTGYPRGLQGEAIPLAARIFAIVDVWDALRSDRPYRKAWSAEQSL
jgi:PAS domain S-box-containing protein